MTLASLLDDKRVCVCLGSGGVGKTTIAAAIALGLAARGQRTAVVTIDPARRLADLLGPGALAGEPCRVPDVEGELWSMTLDPKRAVDELIERLAPDASAAAAITDNRIYRELTTAVAGSQEYAAVAKLHALVRSGRFDCIVLDTPPSRNALDFLDAPGHLVPLLGHRVMRVLTAPAGLVTGALRRIAGAALLHDLAALLDAIAALSDELMAQSREVDALLRDAGTAFVLVTTPERAPVDEALFLSDRLEQRGIALSAVVVNRFHPRAPRSARPDVRGIEGTLARKARQCLDDMRQLADAEASEVARLLADARLPDVTLVSDRTRPVQDARGLAAVERQLFAGPAAAARLLERTAV